MAKSCYVLLSFYLTGLAWTTQHHILITPDNVTSNTTEDICQEHCYTLQHVLTHHDRFFISNTTIELLPGQYVVNESFGNIVIEDIDHFTMTGVSGDSDSRIHCTTYGTLGLYFLNVRYMSVLSIHISNCNGEMDKDIYVHDKQTFAFIASKNISISEMTIEHADGIGLMILGVSTSFQLSQSIFSHNKINCKIVTQGLQNHSDSTHEYTITDSRFAHGGASVVHNIASGITIQFEHEGMSNIDILLSNVTLFNNYAREGNLLFAITNCDTYEYNDPDVIGQTKVTIQDTVSVNTGERYSNKGLVVTALYPFCNSEYRNDNISLTIGNINFIQSCIELNIYFDYLLLSNTVVEGASCTCDYAVSFIPGLLHRETNRQSYTVEDLSVMDSCGSESLMRTEHSTITFQGKTKFLNNSGMILFQNSEITFSGNISVANSISRESPVRLEDSPLIINGNTVFENNVGGQCGGLMLINSDMTQTSSYDGCATLSYIGNKGHSGGAMALYDGSKLQGCGSMTFRNNVALKYGGAIFVDDGSYRNAKYIRRLVLNCFYFRPFGTVKFTNNTAVLSGNALYGGWVDFCGTHETQDYGLGHLVPPVKYSEESIDLDNNGEISIISSNPSRVCLCRNFTPKCNITHYKYEQPLSPGQSFHIQAVAVGQRFGTVPFTVIAEYVNASVKIDEIQHAQVVGRYCTTLNYTAKSPNNEEILQLKVERNFIPKPEYIPGDPTILLQKPQLLVFEQLNIILSISKCPLGYSFDSTSNTCICQETLTRNAIDCYIQNQTVIRRNQMWINATFVHTDSEIGNPGVIIHHNCPFDYCKNLNQQYLDLRYPDDQCAFGRSGILCGKCPQNFSHVLGTSKCKECSNVWTILVLSLFIITGIGLVALLITLNLTVSIGTINGLIFYAHIVRANQAAFLPPQMTNTFLSWFIAWLNLDLGIEMCFFDGLDAYMKTWLQFLFPIYIWVLVIAIIVSSHYSTFAARVSGTNAVQVLATLFLMSYAKMLRITITAFSFATVFYPDGYPRRVWLYDGNVDYLKGKHIPLFTAALILLIFLSIPYTLVLLTIQWLRLLPSYKVLFWVRKFMPLFDAYTGVYKRTHGYWTGLLLLVRVGLFAVFALNVLGDPSINLLAVIATTFCLITYLTIVGGVYRHRHLNLLENSFLLNLGIVSAVTLHTRLAEHTQEKVTKTSVGIAFSTFSFIIIYHAYQQFKSTHKGRKCVRYLHTKFISPLLDKFKSAKDATLAITAQPITRNKPEPTHSSIELREPLLID